MSNQNKRIPGGAAMSFAGALMMLAALLGTMSGRAYGVVFLGAGLVFFVIGLSKLRQSRNSSARDDKPE